MELRDLYDENCNKIDKTYYKGGPIPEGYYPMIVGIAIENLDGKFLMQKRVPEKGGDWGVTGGHPKSGETPYEGIITEVKEELGIDISNQKISEFTSGFDGEECFVMYHVKMDLDINTLTIQKEELTEVKWFSMEELENMVEKGKLNDNQVAFFKKCKAYLNSKIDN